MKGEEGKKLQNVFQWNPNETSRGRERRKSEGQKHAMENIKLICKSREAVIKLLNSI